MNVEQPPVEVDPVLAAYLVRSFRLVDTVFGNIGKLPVRNLLAPKPVVGKLYYYSQAIADSHITEEGLYVYKSTGYKFIA